MALIPWLLLLATKVVSTLGFYGYAREGAVVFPVVALLMVSGRVRFDDVRFGYDADASVLDGMSLDIEPGTSVAVVGATGSGKSTVARLLIRFYDPQSGSVRLGDTEVLVGVNGEVGAPDPDAPDRGQLRVNVEVSSLASAQFAGRGGDDLGALPSPAAGPR